MLLGKVLYGYRKFNKITRDTLGAELELDPGIIHNFEHGKPIKSYSLVKILFWLLSETKPEYPKKEK